METHFLLTATNERTSLSEQQQQHAYQSLDDIEQYFSLQLPRQEKTNLWSKERDELSHKQHNQSQTSAANQSQLMKPKNSLFHNFQKHLLTILKKHIIINKSQIDDSQQANTAIMLWHAFKNSQQANKKILHFVLGILPAKKSQHSSLSMFSEMSQFAYIRDRTTDEIILKAQKLIRKQLIMQSEEINMAFLEEHSSVSRKGIFLQYIKNFVTQLKKGVLASRINNKQVVKMLSKCSQISDD